MTEALVTKWMFLFAIAGFISYAYVNYCQNDDATVAKLIIEGIEGWRKILFLSFPVLTVLTTVCLIAKIWIHFS